jgi:hypothetical protein
LLRRFQRARGREEAEEKELVGESALTAVEVGRSPEVPVGLVDVTAEVDADVGMEAALEELAALDEASSTRADATSLRQMRMRFCLEVDIDG